jgi:hypothetical protein
MKNPSLANLVRVYFPMLGPTRLEDLGVDALKNLRDYITELLEERSAARERNARVQARWDELAKKAKHGHYETLFQIVREEVERSEKQKLKDAKVLHAGGAVGGIGDAP